MFRDELDARRARIDELDARIVGLLNERQAEALAIRSLKEAEGLERLDAEREAQLVSRLVSLARENGGPLREQDIRDIYAAVLMVSKR